MQKLLTLFLFVLLPCAMFAQLPETYTLEFIDAAWIPKEGNNKVLAMFRVTPLKKKFKRVLSMRLAYQVDGGEKFVVNIMDKDPIKVQLVIYGADLQHKDPVAYNLVKEKIAGDKDNEEITYLAFFFPKLEARPDSMRMTYGLWEGKKSSKRVEQDFEFAVKDAK